MASFFVDECAVSASLNRTKRLYNIQNIVEIIIKICICRKFVNILNIRGRAVSLSLVSAPYESFHTVTNKQNYLPS